MKIAQKIIVSLWFISSIVMGYYYAMGLGFINEDFLKHGLFGLIPVIGYSIFGTIVMMIVLIIPMLILIKIWDNKK